MVPGGAEPAVSEKTGPGPTLELGSEMAQPPSLVPPVPPPPAAPGQLGYPGYYAPPPAAPAAAPSKPRAHAGLIAGIAAAVIVVLAGMGVGVYFGFFWENGGDQVAESTSSSASPTSGTATTELNTTTLATETTLPGGGVTQTVPPLTTSTSLPPSTLTTASPVTETSSATTEDPVDVYLATAGMLAAHLEMCDVRIPELAEVINKTLPKVPRAVTDELTDMLRQLDRLRNDLGLVVVPRPFEDADYWLREAATHMALRIEATIQGVETARAAGKVTAKANAFFDQGRKERDAYRAAMPKYYQSLPVE